jgi:hypothetical protein
MNSCKRWGVCVRLFAGCNFWSLLAFWSGTLLYICRLDRSGNRSVYDWMGLNFQAGYRMLYCTSTLWRALPLPVYWWGRIQLCSLEHSFKFKFQIGRWFSKFRGLGFRMQDLLMQSKIEHITTIMVTSFIDQLTVSQSKFTTKLHRYVWI